MLEHFDEKEIFEMIVLKISEEKKGNNLNITENHYLTLFFYRRGPGKIVFKTTDKLELPLHQDDIAIYSSRLICYFKLRKCTLFWREKNDSAYFNIIW